MKRIAAELVAHIGMTLGEGPVWVERDKALWFVDIKEHRAYRFDPAGGSALQIWKARPTRSAGCCPARKGASLPASLRAYIDSIHRKVNSTSTARSSLISLEIASTMQESTAPVVFGSVPWTMLSGR